MYLTPSYFLQQYREIKGRSFCIKQHWTLSVITLIKKEDLLSILTEYFNLRRYSAIRCAAAVPMSTAELQKAHEKVKSTSTDKEANKPATNNYTAPTSKAATKQPKGIMGMFSSKAAPKSEEQSKEVKMEHTDEASHVS